MPRHVFILLCCVAFLSAIVTGVFNTQGKEFILSFMEAYYHTNDMKIIIATSKSVDVQVDVTSPKWFNPYINETFTVSVGQAHTVKINGNLSATGTELSTKGLLVNASDDVYVYGLQQQSSSTDGFLALPTPVLGTEYYAACYFPSSEEIEFLIAGVEDDTLVNITLSTNTNAADVLYNGKSYKPGESITLTMNRFDTFQVQSDGDLTGSYVSSNKPVSVFSGNLETKIKPGVSADHLVEQLPQVNAWGTKFAVFPTPDRNKGYYIKIVASVGDTEIEYTCENKGVTSGNSTVLQKPGHFYQVLLEQRSYCYIESTKTVLVVRFITSHGYEEDEHTDTAMIFIPAIERCYAIQYTFATPKTSKQENFDSFVLFVISSTEIPLLTLDGKAITDLTVRGIPKTDLVAGYFTVSHGTHTVRHSSSNSVFCGFLYGRAIYESYAFPLGFCLPDPSRKCLRAYPTEDCGVDNEVGFWKNNIQDVSIKSSTIWIQTGMESLTFCALVCLRDCQCLSYTYHSEKGTCRGHNHTHTSLGNIDYTTEQGHNYWVLRN